MFTTATIDAPAAPAANPDVPPWLGDRGCESAVMQALRQDIDPALGLSLIDLGLVNEVSVHGRVLRVALAMTPAACELLDDAEQLLRAALPPGWQVAVELRLQPSWSPRRLSEQARLRLGW